LNNIILKLYNISMADSFVDGCGESSGLTKSKMF
jgi:hypothetical protein